jgi:hypothetical protein
MVDSVILRKEEDDLFYTDDLEFLHILTLLVACPFFNLSKKLVTKRRK